MEESEWKKNFRMDRNVFMVLANKTGFSLKSSSSNNSPFYMSQSSECFIVFHSRV